ncbi:uncharacterized protein C8orf48 homolog isoform X2 [Hemicordylus capensis]|uniref:uncharacterized protein C8orf48 homolog isoform X2 n=1 Tax=Hemicordylus capensis TaxID=884348 RepID=UPI002302A29A|nr:uncharacterized protein C8orf48 homolog isoform X2 [Hemicordylus capensis]
MTSWADSSKTCVAEQMELIWNGSGSNPDYSEDTFESFSEGEEETCRQYEDDPFESYYSGEESEWPVVTDPSESTWQSSSQTDEGEGPEFLDPTGKDLTRRWISLLKDNRTDTKRVKPAIVQGAALTGIRSVSKKERGALRSFCAMKINQLCHLRSSGPLKGIKHNVQKHEFTSEKPTDLNCIVPDQLVSRLHLKNITETMKQLAEVEIHQPSRCPHCQKKTEELAQAAFLRRKKTLVEGVLLQEKLEELLYTQTGRCNYWVSAQSVPAAVC